MNPLFIGYVAYKIWKWYKRRGSNNDPPEQSTTDSNNTYDNESGDLLEDIVETLV